MQLLQDKLTRWAIRGIPFPRKRLEEAQRELKLSQRASLEKIVDIRFLDPKTKADLKGWNSTNLKSKYISTYKQEWLPHLKVTNTGKVRFRSEDREKLIELFPDDKVLQSICEPLNMKTAIQQIDKLLVYADGDVLYPNYNLLGAASGRFIASQPELQNLVANSNYNVRNLLLADKNVFEIDFASQEPRMYAFVVKEKKSIENFIVGKNQHAELAKDLNISYKQAKRTGLSLFYGYGHEKLAITLEISNSEAIRIRDSFREKYAKTFEFIEELTYLDYIDTPLLSRRIRLSDNMWEHKKLNRLIQSSCADLLLIALEHVLTSKKEELRAHIHDSLYLACLCEGPHPNCKQEKAASVYKYIVRDTKSYPVYEEWIEKKVKRIWYQPDSSIQVDSVKASIQELEDKRVISVEEKYHNLGTLPVVELSKKQKWVYELQSPWSWKPQLATWYPVRGLIKFAYHTLRQIWKNMILVKPKIIGEFYGQDMKRFTDNPGEMADVIGDMLFSLKQRTPGTDKPLLEILQGDMKIKEWFDGFQSQIDFILIGCGFSPHNEAQVEQTATEIRAKNQTTTDTIKLLKQLRLDQWTRIHDKALIIHGLWDGKGERPYTLSLPEETNLDQEDEIQKAITKIQANLSNPIAEIAKLYRVSKHEAKRLLDENLKINADYPISEDSPQDESKDNSQEKVKNAK